MLSDSADVWNHLREDTTFKTYSDERLALLFLKNHDDFPVHMLIKVFDILLDPRFKLEEITFKNSWDIFRYISDYRRQATLTDEIARVVPTESRVYSVPPLAVSLVVDRMVEDRPQLGVLAEENDWKDAYRLNTADFRAISLVHPTWTPIARSALQRRVVVPHYQVDSFLLSPLCGPWVTEMTVYWTIGNDSEGATESDVEFFRALLERTLQLKSLAFVSSLTWLALESRRGDATPFRVCECLEILSDTVPNIENLWLRHFRTYREREVVEYIRLTRTYFPDGSYERDYREESRSYRLSDSLERCEDTDTLTCKLPGMHSLKFLSVHSWAWKTLTQDDMKWAPSLETVEIRDVDSSMVSAYRSRARGEEVKLSTLSCECYALSHFRESDLPSLKCLQLRDFDAFFDATILRKCDSLVTLELPVTRAFYLPIKFFPPSLEYLKIGLPSLSLLNRHNYPVLRCVVRSVPHLRSVIVSSPSEDHSEETLRSTFEPLSHRVIELCKARGIEFAVESGISRVTLAHPAS